MVWVLSLLSAVGPMSIDMYLPALPTIAQDLGVNAAAVQLTLSTFFVGFAVGQFVYGPLSDRYGRRPMLLFGSSFYVLMSIGCAVSPTVESLTIFRLFQAFAGGAGTVITRAVVRDRYGMTEGAQIMSQMMFIVAFAPLMAPLLGGQLLIWVGWRPIFWVLVVYGILCWVMVYVALPETLPLADRVGRRVRGVFAGYLVVMKSRRVLGCLSAGGLSFAAMFAYLSGTPFVYIEYFGVPAEYFGLLFGVTVFALMIGARINQKLVARFGVRAMLMIGVAVGAGAGLVMVAFAATGVLGLLGIVLPLFFNIGALPLVGANAIALASERYPSQAGAVAALFGTSQFGLGAISGVAVGFLHDGTPVPMAAVVAVCGVGSLLSALLLLRKA